MSTIISFLAIFYIILLIIDAISQPTKINTSLKYTSDIKAGVVLLSVVVCLLWAYVADNVSTQFAYYFCIFQIILNGLPGLRALISRKTTYVRSFASVIYAEITDVICIVWLLLIMGWI